MIAEAGSLSYRNPQQGAQRFIQPPTPAEAIAPTEGDAMLPPLNEDLAQVQGLTERYYDNYGKLKSFVEGMNSKGIDVTKPAYGDPAKMELFNTYKLLEANLITTASQLKNEQKIRTQMAPQLQADKIRYAEGFDPRTQMIGTQNPEDVYYSTNLEPGVEQAMKILSENPMTSGDRQRQIEYFNEIDSELQSRINSAQNPVEKQRLQYQKDQLNKAYQATKLFAPKTTKTTGKDTVEVDVLKRITNLSQGAWPEGTYQQAVVDGRPALVSNAYEGEKYGEETIIGKDKKERAVKRIIDKWVKYDDGTVEIRFKNTEKGETIPPVIVTGTKGDEITSTFISSNPKFGSASKMYQTARELGYLDEGSAAITESLLYDNAEEIKNRGISDLSALGQSFQNEVVDLKAKMSELKAYSGNDLEMTTPKGQKIKVAANKIGSGYYLIVDGKEKLDNAGSDEIVTYLSKNTDYFDKVLNKVEKQSATQSQGKSVSLQTIKSKVGTAGFEGYTEQELVDYYKSQGYTIK